MISQRKSGIEDLLVLLQGLLLVISFWVSLAVYLLFLHEAEEKAPIDFFLGSYVVYCVAMLVGLWLEALTRDSNRADLFEPGLLAKLSPTLRQTAFSIFALFIFLVLTKDRFLSRLFLAAYVPVLYAMLLATNHKLAQWLMRRYFRGAYEDRTLLIGDSVEVERVGDWLDKKAKYGFLCVGILCSDPELARRLGVPLLGTPAQILEVMEKEKISHVILLDFISQPKEQAGLIGLIQARGARIHILFNAPDILRRPVLIEHDEEFYFITMHDEPLESPLNRTLKRLIDFLVALPVVFILLPLLTALVWVLQRMQSPGPVFYRQTRSGIQNEEFEILKFRTMHPHGGPASKQAEKNDGRIFPAGRWLRRFSLDEFPQFINVLRGQMSVIGPRPHLVEHNRQFADALQFFHSRTFIKPGITGLAQVRGFRGETKTVEDIKRRLESDLYYLENWSPMLDIGILLRTVWQVFFPPSTAY